MQLSLYWTSVNTTVKKKKTGGRGISLILQNSEEVWLAVSQQPTHQPEPGSASQQAQKRKKKQTITSSLIQDKSLVFGERTGVTVQVGPHWLQVLQTLTFLLTNPDPSIEVRQKWKGEKPRQQHQATADNARGPDLSSETGFPHSPVIPNTAEEVQGFP